MSQERSKYQYMPADQVVHDCRKCAFLAETKIIRGERHAVLSCTREKAKTKESRCTGQCSSFLPVMDMYKEGNIRYKWDANKRQWKYKELKERAVIPVPENLSEDVACK